MASRKDYYKHLNTTDPVTVVLDMDQLAKQIVNMNYGTHRLLSAVVNAIKEKCARQREEWKQRNPDRDPMEAELMFQSVFADHIEALLEEGHYY